MFYCEVDPPESSSSLASDCTSPFTTAALTPGPHTFRVYAVDAAGNVGDSQSRTFTVEEEEVPAGCEPGDGTECNSVVCTVAPCTVVVSNDLTTGVVTTSSPNAQLFAEINGGDPLTCPVKKNFPSAEYSRDWLQVLALTSLGKKGSKTVTMSTLESSTKPVAS